MVASQGSRTGLSFIAEVTRGTTPATPTMLQIPYKTHSINLSKAAVESDDILPDRVPRHFRHGNRTVGGSLEVDLRRGSYDAFLEAAMFGTWTANVLKTGIVPRYFTIQDAANDISQFRVFKGLGINSMNVSIAPNQMVGVGFEFIGTNMTQASTTVATATTPDEGYEPFDAYSGAILDGGVDAGIVTSLEFSVSNGMENVFGIGSDAARALDYGRVTVTGTMTVRYENQTLLNKFLNEVESSLSVTVDDPTGANPYTFLFPRVKYNGADAPVTGPTGRSITIPFVSLYDDVEATNLKITRTGV